MCFPHLLNLCSGHVAEQYMDVEFESVGEAWVDTLDPSIVIDKNAYLRALQQDPIALNHNIVWLVHASSLCREAFNNTIVTGNQMKLFTNKEGFPTNLPILELVKNVKSWWNLIYLMINRLCIFKQVSTLGHYSELH